MKKQFMVDIRSSYRGEPVFARRIVEARTRRSALMKSLSAVGAQHPAISDNVEFATVTPVDEAATS